MVISKNVNIFNHFNSSFFSLNSNAAILMFDVNCPSGWTRYASLDNKFPMGSAVAGASGGNATHSHNINPHSHTIPAHSHAIDHPGRCSTTPNRIHRRLAELRLRGDSGGARGRYGAPDARRDRAFWQRGVPHRQAGVR